MDRGNSGLALQMFSEKSKPCPAFNDEMFAATQLEEFAI